MPSKPRASKYISLNVLNDLGSRSARRRFIWTFIILAAVTALSYWSASLLEPENTWSNFIRSVSSNLFSAALTVLVVYGAYIYFIREDIERPEIETLRPGDISDEIKELPEDTAFYFLWARSATYFRAETLQRLSDNARKARKTIDVTILLPDPQIKNLSEVYEDMVGILGENDGKDKLFKNAVATSAACALAAANNRNLKVRVCLSNFIPSFRIDMSDRGAILTEDDKSLYALKFSRQSQFFEMFRSMIISEVELSRTVDLSAYQWKKHRAGDEDIPVEALLSFGFPEDRVREYREEIFSIIKPKDHRYK
ncbi:hypothetical protein [Marinibacterium profundimaris]|nr:hypothetical protein [Marinibacterium profundimaris]